MKKAFSFPKLDTNVSRLRKIKMKNDISRASTSTTRSPTTRKTQEILVVASDSPYSMTEELLAKRLRRPIYGHVCRQLFAGILACLSSVSFGTCLGWAQVISRQLSDECQDEKHDSSDHLTPAQKALLISINLLGCSVGITSSTLLMKQMGPKRVLQVVGPFYILVWWILLSSSVKIQLTARFFLGVLAVSYSSAGESLLLQTVHYGIRQYITVFYNATMVFGVLISRVIGTATDEHTLTVICAAIPIVHFVLIQIVPESPVFLYATSHMEAAKSLAWYRGKDNFSQDMANIKKDWDAARLDSDNYYRYMLYSKVVYRPLFIVLVITLLQVSSGYFIFMFYHVCTLSEKMIFSRVIDSAIVGTAFVVTQIFWGTIHMTHKHWKLRGFLISSCFFTAVCLGLFAAYLAVEAFYRVLNELNYVPMMIVMCFLFFVDMGLHYYPKIMIFEYMPFQVYKLAYSVVQTTFWLAAFCTIFLFATYSSYPDYILFAVLAGSTFSGTLFCYLFVVEPRGKSLIQLQLEFGGNPIGTRGALYNQTKQTL